MVEVNEDKEYAAASAVPVSYSPGKGAPEITWANLNFRAGKANILTDCWGKVTSRQVHNLFKYCTDPIAAHRLLLDKFVPLWVPQALVNHLY